MTNLSEVNMCLDMKQNHPDGYFSKLLYEIDPEKQRTVAVLHFAKGIAEMTGHCPDCMHRNEDILSEDCVEEDFSLNAILLAITDLRYNFSLCTPPRRACPRCLTDEGDMAFQEEERLCRKRFSARESRRLKLAKEMAPLYRELEKRQLEEIQEDQVLEKEAKQEEERDERVEKKRQAEIAEKAEEERDMRLKKHLDSLLT
jgi:hypothetical protein